MSQDMQVEAIRARLVRDTLDALRMLESKPATRNTLEDLIGLKHHAQQLAEEQQLRAEVPPTLPAFSPEHLKAARELAASVLREENLV